MANLVFGLFNILFYLNFFLPHIDYTFIFNIFIPVINVAFLFELRFWNNEITV